MKLKDISKHISGTGSSYKLLILVSSLALLSFIALACGVESGDRRPARDENIDVFHRTPLGFLDVVNISITKTESGCEVTPSEVEISTGRVRFSIQNSPTSTGPANFAVPGMEISGASGPGGFGGSTEINIEAVPGPRPNRDFNVTNTGTFDMMCDGETVGTVTVAEA